jgi:hypothetical protein
MKYRLCFLSLIFFAHISWAFCAAPSSSYITLAIANLTGYTLNVDTSSAAPNYHDSHAIAPFSVSNVSPNNAVWMDKAIEIDSCFEMGTPASGTGTLRFIFPNADQGEAGGALGPVGFTLSYSATWDSNRSGTNPEINTISITQNIFDTVPGSTPINGVATIAHDSSSNYAYFYIVFYDLAPTASGNQNVLRPFDLSPK